MADQKHKTGGRLWGARRVNRGISLRELAEASGINRGLLSFFENGRMTPTSGEYDLIIAALDKLEAEKGDAT